MKHLWLALIKIILSSELALAGSPPMITHVEQVSANLRGQTYEAQITQVQMPGADSKDIVLNEIAITQDNGPARVASSIAIESHAELNGINYIASVSEPLSAEQRSQAVTLAQNQVDWVRRNAPPSIAAQIASYPTYAASIPESVVSYGFRPDSNTAQDVLTRTMNSATANANAAFAGIAQQEQRSNLETNHFVQAIRRSQNIALQLRVAALQSDFTFQQSLSRFSTSMQSLHDREIQNLAQQIAHADPVLQNILTDGEAKTHVDIRHATADVSPLNPHAEENLKRYGKRFLSNGLLRDGLFANSARLPNTPAGHRILESANLLSDAVAHDPSLTTQTASMQLVGASFIYLNAAMHAETVGRSNEVAQWTEQGRRIARALRGESVPDDLEQAIASSDKAIALHEQAVRDTLELSGQGSKLLKQAFATVHPTTAQGQVAAAIGRSLVQNPQGLSENVIKQVGFVLLDVSIGMVPGISAVKSLIYMAAGRNLLTGQRLTALDYTLCAIDVLSLGEGGPLSQVAGRLPELLGSTFEGARDLLSYGLKAGAYYVKTYSNFIEDSVKGIREIESVAPGYALRNFASNPGAVLALGQNISRHGGGQLAEDLMAYAAENSLKIVETAHISRFAGGFSKFIPVADFEKYATQTTTLAGRDGGRMFVTATEEFERIAPTLDSDAELANWLSLSARPDVGSGLVRVDIRFDLKLNPRLPDGAESGANQFFKSGGTTDGGAIEITIDPIPMNKVNVHGIVKF